MKLILTYSEESESIKHFCFWKLDKLEIEYNENRVMELTGKSVPVLFDDSKILGQGFFGIFNHIMNSSANKLSNF